VTLRLTLGVLLVVVVLAPSAGAQALTPDQQLVSRLETATAASRAALRSLARPSEGRVAKATEGLQEALEAIDVARKVAPRAVGALESVSMRTALQQIPALTRQARADIANGRYDAARAKIKRALLLKAAALRSFGAPLVREFSSFAVNRNFRNVPAFREYSGLTATAGEEVVEIVIGAATRATATAGEAGAGVQETRPLPITRLTAYQIQDPIGAYTTNWCTLDAGLVSCLLRPTLRPQHKFTIAFTPKLERGTQVLVKFWTASGKRSYSVFTSR
jgi:hypothetical protein